MDSKTVEDFRRTRLDQSPTPVVNRLSLRVIDVYAYRERVVLNGMPCSGALSLTRLNSSRQKGNIVMFAKR
jgi:hypothetical protein